jgi:hypothetical protein
LKKEKRPDAANVGGSMAKASFFVNRRSAVTAP